MMVMDRDVREEAIRELVNRGFHEPAAHGIVDEARGGGTKDRSKLAVDWAIHAIEAVMEKHGMTFREVAISLRILIRGSEGYSRDSILPILQVLGLEFPIDHYILYAAGDVMTDPAFEKVWEAERTQRP